MLMKPTQIWTHIIFLAIFMCRQISSVYGVDVTQFASDSYPPTGTGALGNSIPPSSFVQESPAAPIQRITLIEGRSHLLKFTTAIKRISVSNPAVLDFLALTPFEVMLNAKQHGSVNLLVWDMGNQLSTFDINVTRDPGLLDQLLHDIDPEGHFDIFPSKDVFVVKGETSSVKKMKVIQEAVENFSRGSVSLVRVKDIKQILLQTRFIQVDHTKDRDFGVDLQHGEDNRTSSFVQNFMPGNTATDFSDEDNGTATFANGTSKPSLEFPMLAANQDDVYSFIYGDNHHLLDGAIKAIEAQGITKTIARPNLLAKDGEEASFLVGGEAAILISTNNQVNVQYKEFGTRLTFKPEIMEDGDIMLTIEPEVSTLNTANGVVIENTQVPGFSTTRVKTIVQLKSGETLLLGGLIQQQLVTTESGVPFFRSIPLIGKLFQSFDQDWQETELIVIVTPKIVNPEIEPLDLKKENDLLTAATELIPSRTEPDIQTHAIKTYMKDNNRWKDIAELEKELESISLDEKGKRDQKKKETEKKKAERRAADKDAAELKRIESRKKIDSPSKSDAKKKKPLTKGAKSAANSKVMLSARLPARQETKHLMAENDISPKLDTNSSSEAVTQLIEKNKKERKTLKL